MIGAAASFTVMAGAAKMTPSIPTMEKIFARSVISVLLTLWALRGVGPHRVRIETTKIGGRRYVSRAAVTRFIAALSGGQAGVADATTAPGRTVRQAEQELDADGL